MKITRRQLRRIIQEESIRVLREQDEPEPPEPGGEDAPKGKHGVADTDIPWRKITAEMRGWGGLLVGMDPNIPGRIYAFKKGDASSVKAEIKSLIRSVKNDEGQTPRSLGIQFRVEDNKTNTDARLGRKGTNYRLAGDVELVVVAYGAAPS